MGTTPYPLPAVARGSSIFLCDGESDIYGPFDFSIFDESDVAVLIRIDGSGLFEITDAFTVSKSDDEEFDTFSITFDEVYSETTQFIVLGRRNLERRLVRPWKSTYRAASSTRGGRPDRLADAQPSALDSVRSP